MMYKSMAVIRALLQLNLNSLLMFLLVMDLSLIIPHASFVFCNLSITASVMLGFVVIIWPSIFALLAIFILLKVGGRLLTELIISLFVLFMGVLVLPQLIRKFTVSSYVKL